MKKKIGVYICHCGGNISDYVDVEKVRQAIESEDCVYLSRTTMFACSDSNQKDMVDDITANGLDGVIVASCSPKLHLLTFRNVSERANLKKYTYVHANIREQASWAHSDNKLGATEKAIHLVKAAIAKARYAEALNPIKIEAEKTIAVIGAGIAGMKAALTLSDKNNPVVLIEKEANVGGHVAQWGSLFGTTEKGSELSERIYAEILKRDNITILTHTELVNAKGSIGDFTLTLKNNVQADAPTTECHVGSVVVATGFESYTPQDNEFGYKMADNVITLPAFKKLVDASPEGKLLYNGKTVENVAYVYCVGSRQVEGDNKYCSRNCCTTTIHTAVMARKKFSDLNNFHFTRGVRTYGKQEMIYAESLKSGDIYLQSFGNKPPQVVVENGKTIVKIKDILTLNKDVEVEADLVVLVTGMVPRADNTVGSLFKLPKGRDQFYNEIHMKLRPVETVIDGITIAGTCQSPKNITESVNSALSAATKSYSYISKGSLETPPIVAIVDADRCSWCDACTEACPFDAISSTVTDSGKQIAVINNTVCKGCGMCAPVCAPDAINLTAYSSAEIMSMIDALV
jgi:heterodisulfide reductase subunit A